MAATFGQFPAKFRFSGALLVSVQGEGVGKTLSLGWMWD